VLLAMNGKTFAFFPKLDRPHFASEIGGDFFPGIQTIVRGHRETV
jgi:hypothetical protein